MLILQLKETLVKDIEIDLEYQTSQCAQERPMARHYITLSARIVQAGNILAQIQTSNGYAHFFHSSGLWITCIIIYALI